MTNLTSLTSIKEARRPSNSYFPAIDGLRALAVFCVILFHLELPYFSGGYIGVDVFFVISGYLITRNILFQLDSGRFSFRDFYISRFRRLIPALLFTIFTSLIVGALLYSPDALIRLSTSAIAGVVSLANIRYWLSSGYFDVDSASKPLLHLWSLSVEEQFYVAWPLILIFCFKVLSNKRIGAWVLGVLTLVSYIAAYYVLKHSPDTAFFWMPFRAYEFSLGAFLSLYEGKSHQRTTQSLKYHDALTVLGILCIVASVFFYDEATLFPGYASLLPCLGALMVLIAKNSYLSRAFLANRASTFFGRISYSLYLVHWPVWVFISFWHFNPFSIAQKMGILFLILLFGSGLYFAVEKRFRYSSGNSRDSMFFIGLLLVAVLILLTSYWVRANKGFPNRVETIDVSVGTVGKILCEYPKGTKTVRACTYGDQSSSKTRVLVVGDSHSMNLMAGLDHFGRQNRVSFTSYSVAGCPPLLGIELRVDRQGRVRECGDFSEHLLTLLSDAEYDAVLISARWMRLHEHGPYHATQTPQVAHLSIKLDSSSTNKPSSALDTWRRALVNTINYAKRYEKKVVLFSQYPLLNKGIGECDKSPSYLISKAAHSDRCKPQISYPEIMARLENTNKVVLSFSSDNVLAILPSDQLCDMEAGSCEILTKKGLLYHDSNHLSVVGSTYLIDSITEQLISFLHN